VIAVVDYGMGNLYSVRNALAMVGADVVVTREAAALREAERIVLPGVGAFGECVKNLRASGLVSTLEDEVRNKKKPMLGICVGMQVLADEGHEMGVHSGLGWVPGTVERFDVEKAGLNVPHVGWNEVLFTAGCPLFRGVRPGATFYFVHSYCFVPRDDSCVAARCEYGGAFTAALQCGNVFATQFHPEKSQQNGLAVLENFLAWNP
jgi:glutamine amidotransferase